MESITPYKKQFIAVSAAILLIILPVANLTMRALAKPTMLVIVPPTISYQGYLTDELGAPLNDIYAMIFELYEAQNGGSALWSETQPSVLVQDGYFSVVLGSVQPLDAETFPGSSIFLQVQIDTGGGSVILPRQPLTSVPFAFQAQLAGDADTLDDLDSSYFQTCISENCTPGSAIQAVNSDGTVECSAAIGPPVITRTILDTSEDLGWVANTLGSDGLVLITYIDFVNFNIKVAHCENVACTNASINVILEDQKVSGGQLSITIGTDGLALIVYGSEDEGNHLLNIAHCNNIACTSVSTHNIDNFLSSSFTPYNSIAIGSDGLALISYYDPLNDNLRVAHCDDIGCSNITKSDVDVFYDVGKYNDIAIGSDGLGIISYIDSTSEDIKIAHCSNITCSLSSYSPLDNGEVSNCSKIEIGADGLPLVAYVEYNIDNDPELKVAHCQNITCSIASSNIIDSFDEEITDINYYFSMIIGNDGLAMIFSNQVTVF